MSLAWIRTGTLAISGLLITAIGTYQFLRPIPAFGKWGIKLPQDASILNEIRAEGSLLLCGGLVILSGIVAEAMSATAHAMATLIFYGFFIGRVVSFVLDGKPSQPLVLGMKAEIVLGTANAVGFVSLVHSK